MSRYTPGREIWSQADTDEYARLDQETSDREGVWRHHSDELKRVMRSRVIPPSGTLQRLRSVMADAENQLVAAAQRQLNFFDRLILKYKKIAEQKEALAKEATKSAVHEKLKYAPPRLDMPGGPGYAETIASFGKGRTRKSRKSRRTRKH
jgi:hypothetical protein